MRLSVAVVFLVLGNNWGIAAADRATTRKPAPIPVEVQVDVIRDLSETDFGPSDTQFQVTLTFEVPVDPTAMIDGTVEIRNPSGKRSRHEVGGYNFQVRRGPYCNPVGANTCGPQSVNTESIWPTTSILLDSQPGRFTVTSRLSMRCVEPRQPTPQLKGQPQPDAHRRVPCKRPIKLVTKPSTFDL